jgi:NAD(P)-dependent dehydrogenase (short-subunit alcohol dehydrogenase family)
VVKDLTGKVIIVTGANSGLGYETAKQLAAMKGTIVLGTHDGDPKLR